MTTKAPDTKSRFLWRLGVFTTVGALLFGPLFGLFCIFLSDASYPSAADKALQLLVCIAVGPLWGFLTGLLSWATGALLGRFYGVAAARKI